MRPHLICFPDAAILVLGVSDRAVKGEGGWKSINSVTYLGPVQRDAAKINGACFWDLGKVVMSYGGVAGFVKNGWAAGDHIHINFKGGARIAESLVQAIQVRAYEMLLKREGRSEDIACPIDLEPWKHFTEGVTEEDLSIPKILLPGSEVVVGAEVATVETSNVEEQKPQEVKEEPKAEEPKKEESKKAEPKVEEPKSESSKADAKSAEDFAAEAPKAEPQSGVAPVEEVAAEPQNVTSSAVEAPAVEAPKAEAPVVEAPKAEAPKAEEPSAEAPKSEVSNPETKVE